MTIAVRGLGHQYGDATVLRDVTLTIDDGEFVLLVGPNGAGKTTLVRTWNALLEPTAGTVEVDGVPAADDPVAARTTVGMVFQHPRDQFVAATVGADVAFGPENLGLPRETIEARVADALDAVGMAGREDERIDALSGGEATRVAVAGALAMRPAHLVLDEPLAGLDAAGRRSVIDRLVRLSADGTGVVVVTHDLRDVWSLADRVVGLVDGAVVLDGPPEEVADDLASIDVRPPC